MSEEKLYAIKNDDGEWADTNYTFGSCAWVTPDKNRREEDVRRHGGHVVTFIEEPEKVVLTKEQAEIVEETHEATWPAYYITQHAFSSDDEKLIMNAYVNGYTVAKEKKYLVELNGLVTTDGAKQYLTKKDGKWFASRRMSGLHQDFTDEELNKAPEWAQQLNREEMTAEIEHFGLQGFKKEEVTDDDN
ncbi:DUF1642 domain-containing protein [Latilactobacillus curvatus]|uniref:DUF1642 domain-containing protein n=1 Tax=Latilactobacillus curvatus TaxID=28038 RepID=UPI00223B9BC3|nr:DUF1642 domain-containing protein [Latilactobacillus curvatus]MCS8616164.1 DUF1642 domain-containing protein [Latilactobacillus curvatus]